MNPLRTVSMALKSIFSNKTRSFLTMLGIIIGVSSVIILVTIIDGANKKQMETWYANSQNTINAYYYQQNLDLTDELYNYCLSLSEYVSGVTPSAETSSSVKYRSKNLSDVPVYFGNDKYSVCSGYEIANGRDISYSDIKNRIHVVVIGERVRNELFGLENPVGKVMKIKGRNFTVIGVYKARSGGAQWSKDDMALIPYTLKRELTQDSKINEFLIKARDTKTTEIAVEKIQEFLDSKINSYYGYGNAYTQNEWINQMNESTKMLSMVVGGIAGISLLVGGIGIMNIMLVSVTERTKEIGIRTAIGARRRDIILQFLTEAGVVSGCGGLLGIGIGILGSALGSAAIIKMVVMPSPAIMIFAFLFSMILGIFFGFYPANKASKLQPVEALRRV